LEASDAEIMAQMAAGSPGSLEALFERHHRPLFAFYVRLTGQRPLSEDLVQEVFLRVLRYAGSFHPEAPFRPWFYRIARRVHLDHRRRPENPEVDLDLLPAPTEGPQAIAERIQDHERMERALAALPEAKRELLLLSRDPDLSYADLAGMFGCSEGALKVRVHRALQELRAAFLQGGAS
jgi:RNA polymerase sigma-70 factor (ECF subfamily)